MNDGTVTLIVFLAANTGALIYFAGAIRQSIADHGRRIASVESDVKLVITDVATLKGREAA